MPSEAPSSHVESLYCRHHSWLQAMLRRRLGDACDAADLAHDAFVRLMQAPRRFDDEPAARAWLHTTAKHLCVDLWRRRQIEQAWLDELAARPDLVAPSPEQQAIVVQALMEIDALLRRLPVKAANAFVMVLADGMTHEEAAQALGVSARMVRKYLAQAMLHCLHEEAQRAMAQSAAPAPACGVAPALAN